MKLLTVTIFTAMTSLIWGEEAVETYGLERYREMDFVFTDRAENGTKPIVPELPNWSLVGVRKYRDEQFVTVVNLKDRELRVEIPSPEATELGFSLLKVDVARSFLDTKVKVQLEKETGWLEYNPTIFSSKTSPAKPMSKQETSQNQAPPVPGKRVRYVPRPD